MEILVTLVVPVAIVAWGIAVWSWIAMLRRTRDGRWVRLMFHPLWWIPSVTRKRVTPEGMVYYRRLMVAMFTFMGLIIGVLAIGFAVVLRSGPP